MIVTSEHGRTFWQSKLIGLVNPTADEGVGIFRTAMSGFRQFLREQEQDLGCLRSRLLIGTSVQVKDSNGPPSWAI